MVRIAKSRLAALTCLVTLISSCGVGPDMSGSSPSSSDAEPWRIGVIASSTGPANVLGLAYLDAFRLAVEQVNTAGGINGHLVEVVEDDDESSPETAVTLANKQVSSDNVIGIVGGVGSGVALAMRPVIEDAGVPTLVTAVATAVTADHPRYLFRAGNADPESVRWMIEYAIERGWTRIANLHDTNAYGTGAMEVLTALARDYPVEITGVESYDTADTVLTAQLTRLRQTSPDLLILSGTNPAPALAIKQAREMGWEVQLMGGTGVIGPAVVDIAGEASEGFIAPGFGDATSPRPEQKPFIAAWEDKYGRAPTGFEFFADAMYLMLEALKSVQASPSDVADVRAQLRDSLEQNIRDLYWGTGPWNFSPDSHDGLDARAIIPLHVIDGQFRRLGGS